MKLTILLATYNHATFLQEAIASIVAQTFRDFELIIFDDASTDDTKQVVHAFADDRIRYVQNPCNLGQAVSFNIGFQLARGEYVAVMDDDDICVPDKFEKQIAYLDQHPTVDVLGSHIILFPESVDQIASHGRRADWLPTEDGIIKANIVLMNGSSMIHPTMVVRAARYHEKKLAYPIRHMSIDSGFWVECVEKGLRFSALREVLLYKRNHADQVHKVNKLFWEPEKKFLRKKLLGLYYPHMSNHQLALICDLFEQDKPYDQARFHQVISVLHDTVKDQQAYYGESKARLVQIFNQRLAEVAKQWSLTSPRAQTPHN